MRKIGAVVLAIVALGLLLIGIPTTDFSFRARRAVVSACDDSLRGLPAGTWVRLRGCGVDMFHVGSLQKPNGTRQALEDRASIVEPSDRDLLTQVSDSGGSAPINVPCNGELKRELLSRRQVLVKKRSFDHGSRQRAQERHER